MLRVALVIDDYNELIYLQTILRKIGIDVEGLQNVKKYSELSLGFNPQVLIASAYGKKVNGLEFTKNLHRIRGLPKIILLSTNEHQVTESDAKDFNIDLVLQSPVNPSSLISGLANVANVDEAALHEKFKRLQASGALGVPDQDIQVVGDEDRARDIPRFVLRDQEPPPAKSGSNFKIKPEDPTGIYVGGATEGKAQVGVADLRAQSLSGTHDEFVPDSDAASAAAEAAGAASHVAATGDGSGKKIPRTAIEVSAEQEQKRKDRFHDYVSQVSLDEERHFDRDRIIQFNKKIRTAQAPADIAEIEGDRKEFVRNLFKKD